MYALGIIVGMNAAATELDHEGLSSAWLWSSPSLDVKGVARDGYQRALAEGWDLETASRPVTIRPDRDEPPNEPK